MEDFSLNESGELFIRWNISSSYTKLQFNELISSLIHEFKHTGGMYDAFVQNDGKLIGNEKIVNFLQTKYVKKQIQSEKLNLKFIDEYSFQLTHIYSAEEIQNVKSVKFWYEHYFKIEILNFTEDLKKALDDKIITEEEAIGLISTLDQMILGAAILYDKLSYENLTK